MLTMDESVKTPQISDMLQRFAQACKSKTIEFFAEEEEEEHEERFCEDLSLLDSTEEIITDQKVVVIKPDQGKKPTSQIQCKSDNNMETLISCIFANVSAFKAAYIQLQTAQTPFDIENIKAADRAVIAQLQKLSELKNSYKGLNQIPLHGSQLEAQVQERQSLLRTYEIIVNRLQSEIDLKDSEVSVLKEEVKKIESANSNLTKRLDDLNCPEAFFTVSVFDSVLQDACKAAHSFTKILIEHMKGAGWNLDSAANSVHRDIEYAKPGHNRYAFLSYVCLGMFGGFDSENFCLEQEVLIAGCDPKKHRKFCKSQFVEHGSVDPHVLLRGDPDCSFARFCRKKYLQLIHPSMEESFFTNSDHRDLVLNSRWPSTSLHESFVNMASSIWLLHMLAFSFDPAVGIFQVGRGVEYSMVYMENVARRGVLVGLGGKSRPKVGFTVIPGFRVGKTVIQCQVYLTGMKSTE